MGVRQFIIDRKNHYSEYNFYSEVFLSDFPKNKEILVCINACMIII